ncbi:pyridoxamine 5'-phosphate oxidase family protein, partial [Hansschlegelia beijingensis]
MGLRGRAGVDAAGLDVVGVARQRISHAACGGEKRDRRDRNDPQQQSRSRRSRRSCRGNACRQRRIEATQQTQELLDRRWIERQEQLMPGDFHAVDDPFPVIEAWLEEARATEINDPNAMALATVDEHGMPDVRIVLMNGFDRRGLVFYTNVGSAKGAQLDQQPKAAAVFHWKSLRRQIRGTLVGMNVLGRLLMELREQLKGDEAESLRFI